MQDHSEAENQLNPWSQEMDFEIAIDLPFHQQPFSEPINVDQGAQESFLSIWNSHDSAMFALDDGGFSNPLRPPDLDYAPSHVAEGAGISGDYGFLLGLNIDEPQIPSLAQQPLLSVANGFVGSTDPGSVPRETEVIEKTPNNGIAGR